jgi:hypothetical protein
MVFSIIQNVPVSNNLGMRLEAAMFDIVAAIYATAYCSAQVGLLIGFAPVRGRAKFAAFAAAAAWLAIVVAVYARGGLQPGSLGPVPVNLLPFTLLLMLLFGSWFLVPQFQKALLSVPLAALVAVHAGRIGGVFFLLLYVDGRLSAPFAPAAGVGDVITGTVALFLAAGLALRFEIRRLWLGAWNAFGALDLVMAVTLAALSAPGTPFHVFTEGPGTLVMATLPWAFVPAVLVPIDFLAHFVIAAKLRSESRMTQAVAAVG